MWGRLFCFADTGLVRSCLIVKGGHFNSSCDEMQGNLFSCEEREKEEELEVVVQTRERRGDWGLAGPRGLEGQSGAKVQNTTHWLEVTADPALTNHRKQRDVQIMCS